MSPTEKDASRSVVSGDSSEREAAARGLPLAFRGVRDAALRFFAKPEVRVFSAPVSKGVVLALGLACVAMLGKEAGERERALPPALETVPSAASSLAFEVAPPAPSPPASVAPPVPPPCASLDVASADTEALVDINAAGEKELRTLPGVGAKKAAAILALREKLGRFRKVTDLLRVKGIGPKTLAKWRSRLVVGEPPPKT
jgi:competence ComEA-like helix-hairpin-helix protein